MSNIKIDKLIRSHRKTIGFQITSDARLVVRAPYFTSESLIYKLIERKSSWIIAKQEHFKQQHKLAKPKEFVPGEEFMFLGRNLPLLVKEDLPKAVVLGDSLMIAGVAFNNARIHLECWYKAQAQEYISQRVEYYANRTGLKYGSVRINNASTRWGSCGHTNNLNFSWRLIMAPVSVVDYVIIHELMHLKHKNHSHKFWSEVALMRPDYKQEERWLKDNGYLLRWA